MVPGKGEAAESVKHASVKLRAAPPLQQLLPVVRSRRMVEMVQRIRSALAIVLLWKPVRQTLSEMGIHVEG